MTNEEIIKKLEVGFHSKEDGKSCASYLRLECLKIAFDVAHKVETFEPRKWANKNIEEQIEAYGEVYELAEMNYRFVIKGNE